MAQRKRRTKKQIEATKAETIETKPVKTTNVRPEDANKDFAAEERATHLKKVAAQDKAAKESSKVVNYYYELNGKKLIKRVRKNNGSLQSYYVGNITKDATLLQNEDVKAHLKK